MSADVRKYSAIRPEDHAAVLARFGAMPTTSAVGLLPPPPSAADGDSPDALLRAHEAWHEAWIALRRNGIGASEVATAAGVPGAYGSPFALWWQKKTGLRIESGNDEVMVMGTRLEEIIGETWQARNPDALLVRPGAGLYAHAASPWIVATPDFLAVYMVPGDPWPHIAPVECKAYEGGKGWGTPGTDQVPPHIKVQVLMQIDVLGATRGYVARMQGKRITLYTIDAYPRDDEGQLRAWLHHLQSRAAAFVDSLKGDVPPPIDSSDATEAALAQQYADMHEDERATVSADLALAYRVALAEAREAQERLSLLKNRVRAAIGKAEFATDPNGVIIAQRRRYKRGAYTVAAKEIDGLWPVGGPS